MDATPYGVEIQPSGPGYWSAVVDGYAVPDVVLYARTDTEWTVKVGPMAIDAEYNEACKWVAFVAHSMAWAAGYTTHGEHCMPRNPYKLAVTVIGGED